MLAVFDFASIPKEMVLSLSSDIKTLSRIIQLNAKSSNVFSSWDRSDDYLLEILYFDITSTDSSLIVGKDHDKWKTCLTGTGCHSWKLSAVLDHLE